MKKFPFYRSRSLAPWLSVLLILLLLLSSSSFFFQIPTAFAFPLPQTEITTQSVIDALSTWFNTYGGFEFSQRGWISVGDLGKVRARLDQWDVEAYVDPGYLSETNAFAAYVDYTNAGLGYFNDLVFAAEPANVAPVAVWHEVMHSIFDAHDSDLKVTTDEIYTWYMEGQIVGLVYLMRFENELSSPDCDPEELEVRWGHYDRFLTQKAIDYGGYGSISPEGKTQLAQLTGFQIPDIATLRGLYESSGLIDKCGETAVPVPTAIQAQAPTQKSTSSGKTTSSRMFLIDNSGSMDGEGIVSAISSAQSTLSSLPATTEVAVQFFGISGCDVSVVQEFTLDHSAANQVIAGASAYGDTPLAAAISQGGSYMRANASTKDMVMILLSDGEETCDGDPVDAAGQLNSSSSILPPEVFTVGGIIKNLFNPSILAQGRGTITLHVVGFGIEPDSETETQLRAIAAAGLGNYYQADDEIQLTEALKQAAEDSGASQFPSLWIWICGGSLLCLMGLAAVVGGIIFITRRSRKSAEDGSLEITSSPTASKSSSSPPAKEVEIAAKKTAKKTTKKKPAPIVCKSCGEGIKPNAKTCSHCGAPQDGGKE